MNIVNRNYIVYKLIQIVIRLPKFIFQKKQTKKEIRLDVCVDRP